MKYIKMIKKIKKKIKFNNQILYKINKNKIIKIKIMKSIMKNRGNNKSKHKLVNLNSNNNLLTLLVYYFNLR